MGCLYGEDSVRLSSLNKTTRATGFRIRQHPSVRISRLSLLSAPNLQLDKSTSLNVCYPFDMFELMSVNGNTRELGFTYCGIPLKNSADVLDQNCTPKYALKMTTEIGGKASGELKLYFSNDGGVTFYNEMDPHIAIRVASEDEIHARCADVCAGANVSTSSSCFENREQCTFVITTANIMVLVTGLIGKSYSFFGITRRETDVAVGTIGCPKTMTRFEPRV